MVIAIIANDVTFFNLQLVKQQKMESLATTIQKKIQKMRVNINIFTYPQGMALHFK